MIAVENIIATTITIKTHYQQHYIVSSSNKQGPNIFYAIIYYKIATSTIIYYKIATTIIYYKIATPSLISVGPS